MRRRFGGGDSAGLNELLNKGVVRCDLIENAVAVKVNAGISDVRNDNLVVVANQRTDRRSHALQIGMFAHRLR